MKSSNPKRNVPRNAHKTHTGEHPGRSDFAHAARSIADFERDTKRHERLQLAHGGTAPVNGDPAAPKKPPVLVLYEDLIDEPPPRAIYGQYPHGLIAKMLPWLRCQRQEILHVCSGALPKPVAGTRFVKAFGLSTGFDMPMRAAGARAVGAGRVRRRGRRLATLRD